MDNLNLTVRVHHHFHVEHECPPQPAVSAATFAYSPVTPADADEPAAGAVDPKGGPVADLIADVVAAALRKWLSRFLGVAAVLLLPAAAAAQSPTPPGPPPSPAHEWAYLGAGGSYGGWGWGLKGVARPALGSPCPGGVCLPAAPVLGGCVGGACGVPAAYPQYPQFAPAYPVFGGGCPGGRCR